MLIAVRSRRSVDLHHLLGAAPGVTPPHLLGRMTSTMPLADPAARGAGRLLGGWLGEHVGLRASLAFAGGTVLILAWAAWRQPVIRDTRALPTLQDHPAELAPSASTGRPDQGALATGSVAEDKGSHPVVRPSSQEPAVHAWHR